MYSIRFQDVWSYYKCSTHQKSGACGHCIVDQKKAMRAVANKIREHVLMSGYDKLLAAVERELDRRATRAPVANQAGMRRQLAGIEQKIENATDRLVSVAKSLVPAVEAKLVDLQRQRDELAERLHRSPNSTVKRDAKAIADQLWRLDEVLAKGSPATVRNALGKIVEKITLQFREGKSTPKRKRFEFVRGEIQFAKPGTPSGRSWRSVAARW